MSAPDVKAIEELLAKVVEMATAEGSHPTTLLVGALVLACSRTSQPLEFIELTIESMQAAHSRCAARIARLTATKGLPS